MNCAQCQTLLLFCCQCSQVLEELESIRAYDAAKASGDEVIPFEQAVTEIERERR
jgi:hypothetical protein